MDEITKYGDLGAEGEEFEITNEKIGQAERLILKIKLNYLETAIAIKTLHDDRLFLCAQRPEGGYGYETFAEFVEDRLGWTLRNAQKYISIANAFHELPLEKREKFSEMTITSLHKLSRLPDETREQMISSGSLVLATGEEVSIDELVKIRSKEIVEESKKLSLDNSDMSAQISEHKRDEALYESLLKNKAEEIETLNRMIDIPPEEREFHRKITRVSETRTILNDVHSLFFSAFMKLLQIEVDDQNRDVAHAGINGIITMVAENISAVEASLND